MRRRAGLLLLLTLGLAAACGKETAPTPLQVGNHAVSVVVPAGWEHLDYGDHHQFRRETLRVSLQDLGKLGRNLDAAAKKALGKLRELERREIASTDTLQVSGRDARLIDTWDDVSHQYRKRFLFVLDGRSLLVMYPQQLGTWELMADDFDRLAGSLAYVDSLETASGGREH